MTMECKFSPGDAIFVNERALVASNYIGQTGVILDTIPSDYGVLVHVKMKDDILLLCVPEGELSAVSDEHILNRSIQEWGKESLSGSTD